MNNSKQFKQISKKLKVHNSISSSNQFDKKNASQDLNLDYLNDVAK